MLGAIANLHPDEQSRLDEDNIKHKMRGEWPFSFLTNNFSIVQAHPIHDREKLHVTKGLPSSRMKRSNLQQHHSEVGENRHR
jgi:hypothetical protein